MDFSDFIVSEMASRTISKCILSVLLMGVLLSAVEGKMFIIHINIVGNISVFHLIFLPSLPQLI